MIQFTTLNSNVVFLRNKKGHRLYYGEAPTVGGIELHTRGIRIALKRELIRPSPSNWSGPEQIYAYTLTTLGKAWLKLQQ